MQKQIIMILKTIRALFWMTLIVFITNITLIYHTYSQQNDIYSHPSPEHFYIETIEPPHLIPIED